MKQCLLTMLLSVVSVCSFSQKITNADFAYPIKPGDGKWEKMNSVVERVASLQIPESIISEIPTERLLDICLDYPYLLDVLCYDDFQKGIEALRKNFNGFNELLSRKDLGKFVLVKDRNFPLELDKIKDKTDIEKGKFSLQYFVLELILVQDNVLAALNSNEEDELSYITVRNMELKAKQTDIFSSLNTIPSDMLYAKKALIDPNLKFNAIQQKSSIWDRYSPTTVKTPNGSIVPKTGTLTGFDTSSSLLAYWREKLKTDYFDATLVDVPTDEYNCHAYAWHVSEGGNKVWIGIGDPTAEDVYWTDGSYTEVPESYATKVSYHESGNHSAVRVSDEWYISKWGAGPLVKHHPNDVPIDYNPGMPKKFYAKLPGHISGPTFICSSADYSISNLPEEASVKWSYTPVYPNITPNIQQDASSTNTCTVYNTYGQIFEGYLKADIVISGTVIKTISRLIRGDSDRFVGFYWQVGSDGSWGPDTSISLEEPNIATPPYDVIIESDNFRGKNIYYSISGSKSILQPSASNRVSFEMPSLPNGELLTILVEGSDCGNPITFTFEARNNTMILNKTDLNITSLDANHYSISVDWDEAFDIKDISSDHASSITTETPKWIIEVHDAINTQKIMEMNVTGDSYILDMSAFNSGIYVIRAIMGDKVSTGKINKR